MLEQFSPEKLRSLLPKLGEMTPKEQMELLDMLEKYDLLKEKDECRNHLVPFMKKIAPNYLIGPHHRKIAKVLEAVARGEKKRVIINIAPRHALALGTFVPTTAGMKTVEELRVGDEVFSPDGHPTVVTGKSEVFKDRQLYRVWTDDNSFIDTDGEHLWTVRLHRKHDKYLTYTTEQLWRRQNGEVLRTKRGGGVEFIAGKSQKSPRLPRLPDVAPAEYPFVQLPIDPYVLGVWLGDGSKRQAIITSHPDDSVFIRAEFEKRGYPTRDQKDPYTFGVGGLRVQLKEIGLLGETKFIPEVYLRASVEQRMELLRGLMDTDGSVSKKGQCFFNQSNYTLIKQFQTLIHSLGIKGSLNTYEAKIGDTSYGDTWEVSFYASDIFKLPRKESRTLGGKRTFGRYIKVEKLPYTGSTQCISVAGEDGLFLAGEGYICTHNSKSESASYMFPGWFLGNYPEKKIIMASHTAELATNFGRRVRNMMDMPEYQDVFPDVALSADSKAAGRWDTNAGGQYFAIGVGGALAGRGGDLILIDDPISEQDAKSGSVQVFLDQWEWFQQGLMTRLMPGGAVVVLMCMTGDTSVRMADGTEKRLDTIKVGDEVATYEDGELTTTTVLEFQSSGIDTIFTIETQSGIILRANERHPFLVEHEGERKWVRVRDLKKGMSLVALRDVTDQQDRKQNRACATHAKRARRTTENTPTHHTTPSGIMVSIKGKIARLMGVINRLKSKVTANPTTLTQSGEQASAPRLTPRKNGATPDLNTDMGLTKLVSTLCSLPKAAYVLFAGVLRRVRTLGHTGATNYALTTATTQGESGGCYATTVTLQSDMQRRQKLPEPLPSTSAFTTDNIVSVEVTGEEEVFDVQIERTENFIANGVVSHNTRWSTLDLTGQITNHMTKNPDADQWEVIEFPAILNEGTEDEKPLWPEFWSLDELKKKRISVGPVAWAAQYMQNPTAEGSQLLKREWWKHWDKEDPPDCVYTVMSLDAAQETHNRADYNACTLWGVFYVEGEDGRPQEAVILLNAWKERMEFPDLKKAMFTEYEKWSPDTLIVEKKSNGAALYQEMRRAGIPVTEFTPSKGQDKIARVNAVSDMLASGLVYAPTDRRWAQELITECAEFPLGAHDDMVDSMTAALLRIRQGGLVRLPSDEDDDDLPTLRRRGKRFY